jgi:hypothetical protein
VAVSNDIRNDLQRYCADLSSGLSRQLEVSEQLLKSLKRVEGIAERANPTAAGDFDRLTETEEQQPG